MGEFFRGWRRKVGCVTPMMACVFAAGWVRSFIEQDVFARLNDNDTHLVVSMNGCVWWERLWPIIKARQSRLFYRHGENPGNSDNPWEGCDVHWNVTGFGFDFRAFSKLETAAGVAPYTQEFALWEIPYWSITIPLSLISFWLLLLTKPRKSTRMKIAEPITVEGT